MAENEKDIPEEPQAAELDATSQDQDRKGLAIQCQESSGQMMVELNPGFTNEDWEGFTAFAKTKLGEGIVDWSLDLRRLQLITSMFLGAIIGLNMVVQSRRGTLRLIVEKDSRISKVIHMSKINRIITVRDV